MECDNYNMPELTTIERMLKERDTKIYYLRLLKEGSVQEVIDLLQRDINTINESIQTK